MIEQSVKSLPKANARSEISADKKKCRPFSTSDSGCSKPSSPGRSSSKPSSPESSKLSFEMACERQRLRMKMLESRNAAEETSEGVQQFIRHVSSFIEKKNPFKDKAFHPSDPSGKPVSPLDTIQFRRTSSSSLENQKYKPSSLERLSEMILTETQKLGEEQMATERANSQAAKKRGEGSVTRKAGKGSRKSEFGSRKTQKQPSPDIKTIPESLEDKKQCHPLGVEQEIRNASFPETDSRERVREGRAQNADKKKKPSEIPLRKKKAGSNRTQKPVSQPVQDPMNSLEIPEMSKSLSPLEELSVCSELQLAMNEEENSMRENIRKFQRENNNDESAITTTNNQSPEDETESSKKLETYFKCSGVSAVYSSELLEETSSGERSLRIDMDKIKTTSFTILQSEGVLERLESFHKQNMLVSSKTKVSVKALKGKSSRKSLSRTGLKAKTKRSKRDLNLTRKDKLKNDKSVRQDSGKARWDNRKNMVAAKPPRPKEAPSHVPVKLVRTKAKSLLRGIQLPKETEEPAVPSIKFQESDDLQNREKPEPENSTVDKPTEEIYRIEDNKCEGMGDSKSKEEDLVVPPSDPEQNGTPANCRGAEDGVWPANHQKFAEKVKPHDSELSKGVEEIVNKSPEVTVQEDSKDVVKFDEKEAAEDKTLENSEKDPKLPEVDGTQRAVKRLRIDVQSRSTTTVDQSAENAESFDWLFMNEKSYDESPCDAVQENNLESGRIAEENAKSRQEVVTDSLSSEVGEEPGPLNISIQKPQKSCCSIKRRRGEKRRLYKSTEGATKTSRKKKIRPDAGGRRLPSPNGFFNSEITLLNKTTRERSGLNNFPNRDEKRDIFEEAAAAKLKRRNSEPYCLRGYIWKCADAATARGHKPSVSSMASSLRHLNTDDIDDFIFWEAVPPRKTAWEASLYHFKRPWSLLSCSVFKDNRRSSTPGLILENLRNGGGLRRFGTSESERLRFRKENPFDVEPSIAQKNIDIRNWLAALNFPMIPSTSSDFLSESNLSAQSTSEAQNRNKIQMTPRRRKVGSNLKFSEEPGENRCEEKEKIRKTAKWSGSESESLTDLTRRKSGGFVTKEQFMNSEHAIRRPNATVNLCVYSKSAEESLIAETADRGSAAEPRKFKSVEIALQPQESTSATIVVGSPAQGDQAVEKCVFKKKSSDVEMEGASFLGGLFKGELSRLISGLNIWKYLFMLTVFVVAVHYFCLRS